MTTNVAQPKPLRIEPIPRDLRIRVENVSVRMLLADDSRHYWEHYAEHQRDLVWSLEKQQYFLWTLFSPYGFVVPELWFNVRDTGEVTETQNNDGKQRLASVYRFRDGGSALPTEAELRRITTAPIPAIAPGRTYAGLKNTRELERFLSYTFRFVISENAPEWWVQEQWRMWNFATPPRTGERLRTHTTSARYLADRLHEHPIWNVVYGINEDDRPRDNRQQIFEMCCYLIYLRLRGYPNQVSFQDVNQIIGAPDWQHLVTPALEREMWHTLDGMCHLFDGIKKIRAKTHIVTLWMVAKELESRGVHPTRLPRGHYVQWFEASKDAKRLPNAPSWVGLMIYSDLRHRSIQETFLNHYRPEIFRLAGVEE